VPSIDLDARDIGVLLLCMDLRRARIAKDIKANPGHIGNRVALDSMDSVQEKLSEALTALVEA
jgi:hypothetical protein